MRTKSSVWRLGCLLVFISLSLSGTGCVNVDKLPLVNATKFEYSRSNLVSSATVTAENVHVTAEAVTADSMNVALTYPFVGTVTLKVQGYRRERKP